MKPFFVADRPMSLRVLKGLKLAANENISIGIMAHANTSLNFQNNFRDYPCDNFDFCDAVKGPCQYRGSIEGCPHRQLILSRTVKMCDSGIFTKEGAMLSYQELFDAYKRMNVEYGIMIDVFGDAEATIKSAREGLVAYENYKDDFNLVAVAQGKDFDEYIDCYEQLRQLGFEHIAIGGLLRRMDNTVRYVNVGNEEFMEKVLREIRQRYPRVWLFALGCFNPNRIPLFEELNVWADYKGWIFRYDKRDEVLNKSLPLFTNNHLEHTSIIGADKLLTQIKTTVARRMRWIDLQQIDNKKLYATKRNLRDALQALYTKLVQLDSKTAQTVALLTTRGLLTTSELTTVEKACHIVHSDNSKDYLAIQRHANNSRKTKDKIDNREKRIEKLNQKIAQLISKLLAKTDNETLQSLGSKIVTTIKSPEQDFRLFQIRDNIDEAIFKTMG